MRNVSASLRNVSIAISTHKVQKLLWEERMLGNLFPCSFWQPFWIALCSKPSLLGAQTHVHINDKQSVLQGSPEHSWAHTGQEEGSRWASSSPVSQSSALGGACHVLPLFSCSCEDSEHWLTSGREKTQVTSSP